MTRQPDQHSKWLKEQVKAAEARERDPKTSVAAWAIDKAERHTYQAALQHYEESGPFLSVGEVRREDLLSEEAIRIVSEVLDEEFATETGGEAVTDYALAERLLKALDKAFPPEEGGDGK